MSKKLNLKEYIQVDRSLENYLPLLKTKEFLLKVTYNRKNFSDILEAIIGSLYLSSSSLHLVHDFLEQKLFFYGSEYTTFLETIMVSDEEKFKNYIDVFCTNHEHFLDWISYCHPDKLYNVSEPFFEQYRILSQESYLDELKRNSFFSKSN
jgi:hypothetical protein